MQRWAADDFPTTLFELGHSFSLKLESYLRRISGYVEDYIWKTIGWPHIDQTQMYARLPDIASDELSRIREYRQGTWKLPYRYVFNGFVQYELICLLHRPRPIRRALSGKPLPRKHSEGLPELPNEWDFAYLEKLKEKTGAVSELWAVDWILSVFEYVASVYGALFHILIHKGYIPPNRKWNAETRQSIMDGDILTGHLVRPQSCDKWRFLDRLSMNGLGCLDNLLRGTLEDFTIAMKRFNMESSIAGITPMPFDRDPRLAWGLYGYDPDILNQEVGAEEIYVWKLAMCDVTIRARHSGNPSNDRQINPRMARDFKRSGYALLKTPESFGTGIDADLDVEVRWRMYHARREMTENAWIPGDYSIKNPGLFRATKRGHLYNLADGRLVLKRNETSRFKKVPMPTCGEWESAEDLSEFPSLKPYLKGLWERDGDREAFRRNRFMYGQCWNAL